MYAMVVAYSEFLLSGAVVLRRQVGALVSFGLEGWGLPEHPH